MSDQRTRWEYMHHNVGPGESWFDELRRRGADGWEAWHIERSDTGWRALYFKRPIRSNEVKP